MLPRTTLRREVNSHVHLRFLGRGQAVTLPDVERIESGVTDQQIPATQWSCGQYSRCFEKSSRCPVLARGREQECRRDQESAADEATVTLVWHVPERTSPESVGVRAGSWPQQHGRMNR